MQLITIYCPEKKRKLMIIHKSIILEWPKKNLVSGDINVQLWVLVYDDWVATKTVGYAFLDGELLLRSCWQQWWKCIDRDFWRKRSFKLETAESYSSLLLIELWCVMMSGDKWLWFRLLLIVRYHWQVVSIYNDLRGDND